MADTSKLRIFEGLNPWWTTFEVPNYLQGMERKEYLANIEQSIEKEEIQIITGIRRCGKTTLLYQTIEYLIKVKKIPVRNILLVNCDEAIISENFESITEIISAFNETTDGKKYIFLDEIQYFENWEQQLKNSFDRFRSKIKFIVSGSSAMLIKSKNLYFLTGRFIPLTIFPFSFEEFLEFKGIMVPQADNVEEKYKQCVSLNLDQWLYQYLVYGGFPQIIFEKQPDEKNKLAKTYFETILYKDILKLWEVKDITALEKIGRFVLQNIGQRFSYRKISDVLARNLKTTQNYIEYLSNSFLIYFIGYYASSSALQIKKEKKIYTIDNILHTSYYGNENLGGLAENLVFIHLLKKVRKINYWKDRFEVDFVIGDEIAIPLEVKYQNSINNEDLKGIESFFKHHEHSKEGILITKNDFDKYTTKDGKAIKIIPLWLYLIMK